MAYHPPMARLTIAVLTGAAVASLIAACGDDGRPVNIPMVPAGEYEAMCQTMCTLASGEDICGAKHAEFCLASCRARTNGLPSACATCLFDRGAAIAGEEDGFGDPVCNTGGPAKLDACQQECDDGGAAAPSPALADLCDLTCGFWMTDEEPLACSEEGSADCRTRCAATIAAKGRVCAQCTIDQTGRSRTCINGECDCEPLFDETPPFGCDDVCDNQAPT